MRKSLAIVIFLPLLFAACDRSDEYSSERFPVIPVPMEVAELPGEFVVGETTRVITETEDPSVMLSAELLAGLLRSATGFEIPAGIYEGSRRGSVILLLDEESELNDEGYLLIIKPGRVLIKSASPAGLFYGVQTIRQLLPAVVEKGELAESAVTLPSAIIKDEPEFEYRGMHLDVARHIFPVEYVKRYIDMLALHKMNRFHWHLTEDQGWRIEIDTFPLLTEIGAWRKETLIGHGGQPPFKYDGRRYGGYYTKDEVRDIVQYASDRFVTIIPEIEMPGHAMAALAAYPQYSCTGGPFEVATRWGVFDEVYCAGKDETFEFLEAILAEVIELFPGEYIHIGGDECPKVRWEECPDCQKRIAREGLKDEHELQSYFIKRIEQYLLARDRRIIGWDEILEGGLAPEATVMSWRGIEGGIEAARQGHDVIMTPTTHMYFDYYQTEPEGEPLGIGGYLPLEKVYSFEPVPEVLEEDERHYILGVQGNLWSEYLPTPGHMEYMAYPRFFAVSEIGWSDRSRMDFDDFVLRLSKQGERYDAIGINRFRGEYYNTREPKEQ